MEIVISYCDYSMCYIPFSFFILKKTHNHIVTDQNGNCHFVLRLFDVFYSFIFFKQCIYA